MKKICVLLLCAVLLSGTVGNYIYPSISLNEVQASVAISPEIVGAFSQWLYSLFLSADIVEYSSSWNERYVDMEKVMLSDDIYDYAQYCEIVEICDGVSLSYEDYITYLNEHIYGADYVSGSGALQISEEGQRVFEVLEGGGGGSEPDNNEKPPSFQVSVGLSAMAGALLGADDLIMGGIDSGILESAKEISDVLKNMKQKYNFSLKWQLGSAYGNRVSNWEYRIIPRFTGLPVGDNFMFHMEYTYSSQHGYVQHCPVAKDAKTIVPVALVYQYGKSSDGVYKYCVAPVVVTLNDGIPVSWSSNPLDLGTRYYGFNECSFGTINTTNTSYTNWPVRTSGYFGLNGEEVAIVSHGTLFSTRYDASFLYDTDFGLIIGTDLNSVIARLNQYILKNDPTVFDNFSGYYVYGNNNGSAFSDLEQESVNKWTDALSQPFTDGSLLIDGAEDISSLQDVTVDTLPEIYPEIYPEYQPDVDFSQYPEIYPDYDPVANPNPVPAVKPDPERVVENVVENVIVPDGAVEPLPDVNPDIEPDVESNVLDTGNLAGVTFSLSDYFPFCIPFDLIDAVRLLASKEAVAPRWEWTLDVDLFGYGVHHTFVLDMSQFEDLARVMRVFETLFFVVGLIVITRNIIRG